jgi:hypothetical protein
LKSLHRFLSLGEFGQNSMSRDHYGGMTTDTNASIKLRREAASA